jgi:hypothetical protein
MQDSQRVWLSGGWRNAGEKKRSRNQDRCNGYLFEFNRKGHLLRRLEIPSILKLDLRTGETQEYVYVLDAINRGQGVCEILAINDHEFLVVERDNRSFPQTPPQAPRRKTIYKINLTGATDVSSTAILPAGALPAGVTPVTATTT